MQRFLPGQGSTVSLVNILGKRHTCSREVRTFRAPGGCIRPLGGAAAIDEREMLVGQSRFRSTTNGQKRFRRSSGSGWWRLIGKSRKTMKVSNKCEWKSLLTLFFVKTAAHMQTGYAGDCNHLSSEGAQRPPQKVRITPAPARQFASPASTQSARDLPSPPSETTTDRKRTRC
jgi:hypothetical protein